MSAAEHLDENTLTVRPVRGREGHWTVVAGGETLGHIGGDLIEVGDRRLRLVSRRGHDALVDTVTSATVGTLQRRAHGSVALAVGRRRFRLVREGVLPFFWQATEDLGGPQVLRMLRLGAMIRVQAGADAKAVVADDLDLLLAAVLAAMLDLPVAVEATA